MPAAWAAYTLAAALLETGNPADAAHVLVTAAGDDALPHLLHPMRTAGFELLTRCRLALHHVAEADAAAAAAQACARQSGLTSAQATADRATAAVALYHQDPLRAADLALAAAKAAESVGAAIEAATARQLAGRALALADAPERAIEQVQLAAAAFDRCGAARRRAHAERQLRQLGYRGTHHRTGRGSSIAGGVAALTERELQVARLVTDRRTNTEIATELFLSRKTVETHIRNLFQKLAVSSRVEIARAVEQIDRDETS
jgi:DNA-binding NarL/FixJ family response regulator